MTRRRREEEGERRLAVAFWITDDTLEGLRKRFGGRWRKAAAEHLAALANGTEDDVVPPVGLSSPEAGDITERQPAWRVRRAAGAGAIRAARSSTPHSKRCAHAGATRTCRCS